MSAVREEQRSLGELFRELSEEAKRLVRQEVELAKTEIKEKLSELGKDPAFIAIGGILAYSGFLVLLAALVIGLGHLIGYGWSALVIGALVVAAGAGLAMSAIKKMKTMSVAPEKTVAQIKETKQWAARQL